jgi:predicted NBD/HSP70 family sugar kinase/glycosyltransferase involved in cell wall biosynthesis
VVSKFQEATAGKTVDLSGAHLVIRNLQSKFFIDGIKENLKVSFVIPVFNEAITIQKASGNPNHLDWYGQDALRMKIAQLEHLFGDNPGIEWKLLLVDDGDPTQTLIIAEKILKAEYPELYEGGKVKLLRLQEAVDCNLKKPTYERNPIFNRIVDAQKDSEKGGAVLYGIDEAIKEGADIILYTDFDILFNLGQTGILLKTLLKPEVGIVIGSRMHKESVLNYTSKIRGVYNAKVREILPMSVSDVQSGFKALKKEVAEKVLPFMQDKRASFDTELLLRAILEGYKIEGVGVVGRINPRMRKFNVFYREEMLKGVRRQRKNILQNISDQQRRNLSLCSGLSEEILVSYFDYIPEDIGAEIRKRWESQPLPEPQRAGEFMIVVDEEFHKGRVKPASAYLSFVDLIIQGAIIPYDLKVRLWGKEYIMLPEKEPRYPYHTLLASTEDRPNILTDADVYAAVEFVQQTGLRLLNNCSKDKQLHFHITFSELELPIEAFETTLLAKRGKISISEAGGFPATNLIFSGEDSIELADCVYRFISILQERGISYNLIFSKDKVIIFPRQEAEELDKILEGKKYLDALDYAGRLTAKKELTNPKETIPEVLKMMTIEKEALKPILVECLKLNIEGMAAQHRVFERESVKFEVVGINLKDKLGINIDVTQGLSEEFKDELFRYLGIGINNYMMRWGPQEVAIYCSEEIREGLEKTFRSSYIGVTDFLDKEYHEGNFSLKFVNSKIEPAVQAVSQDASGLFNPGDGVIIGVDRGGTSIKVSLIKDGQIVDESEILSRMDEITSADAHIEAIKQAIDSAMRNASIDKIDAIGISWAGAVRDGKVVSRAKLRHLSEADFTKVKDIKKEVGQIFNVPVYLINDGDAGAFCIATYEGKKGVLCIGIGRGLSGGFIDGAGNLDTGLHELGFMVIDFAKDAPRSSRDIAGAAQQYISERGLLRIINSLGLFQDSESDSEKMKHLIRLSQDNNPQAVGVFELLGIYLAEGVAEFCRYYDGLEEVIIFGGIARSGEKIIDSTRRWLETKYPDLKIKVSLSVKVPLEFVNSRGAAQFANSQRQKVYIEKLRSVLKESEEAFIKEMDTTLNLEPSADLIVLISGTEEQKCAYEEVFAEPKKALLRQDVPFVVLAGPEIIGPAIGTNGAVAHAMDILGGMLPEISKTYPRLKNKKLDELRIVLIKAGGLARRIIPAAGNINKGLLPLPIVDEDGKFSTTLFQAIKDSYKFTQKMREEGYQGGFIVLTSDQLLVTRPEIRSGVNHIISPVPKGRAKRPELIIEAKGSRKMILYSRKPGQEDIEKFPDSIKWFNLSTVYIVATKDAQDYRRFIDGLSKIAKLIRESDSVYEIFTSDFILPFFIERCKYVDMRIQDPQTEINGMVDTVEKRKEFYQKVYDIVKEYFALPIFIAGSPETTYCDEITDTSALYLRGLMPTSIVARVYDFKSEMGVAKEGEVNIGSKTVVYYSRLCQGTNIGDGSAVFYSLLREGSIVGDNSLVYKVKGVVNIGDSQILTTIPIITKEGRRKFALVYVGLRDDPKKKGEYAALFGLRLTDWLNAKGLLQEGKLFGIYETDLSKVNIWDIPIWPLLDTAEVNMYLVEWMSQPEMPASADYLSWERISLRDIHDKLDYKTIIDFLKQEGS